MVDTYLSYYLRYIKGWFCPSISIEEKAISPEGPDRKANGNLECFHVQLIVLRHRGDFFLWGLSNPCLRYVTFLDVQGSFENTRSMSSNSSYKSGEEVTFPSELQRSSRCLDSIFRNRQLKYDSNSSRSISLESSFYFPVSLFLQANPLEARKEMKKFSRFSRDAMD